MESEQAAVLRTKFGARSVSRQDFKARFEVARFLEKSFEAAATTILRCETSNLTESCNIVPWIEAFEGLPDTGLFSRMGMTNSLGNACICVDQNTGGHLVDLLAGGDVSPAANAERRMLTGLDSAVAGRLFAVLWQSFDDFMRAYCGSAVLSGATTPLALVRSHLAQDLDQMPFLALSLNLDLGSHARTGRAIFLLPLDALVHAETSARILSGSHPSDDDMLWSRHMMQIANAARVNVRCVLARQFIDLDRLARFNAGDLVALEATSANVALESVEPDQTLLFGVGDLGVASGRKAFRQLEGQEDLMIEASADAE